MDLATRRGMALSALSIVSALSVLIAAHGGLITGMHQERLSLEEAFVRLTADNVAAAAGRRLTGAPASGPTTRATPRRVTKRRAAR